MPDSKNTRLHASVEGRVQGVGFRNFVQITASDSGVTGWVRNRWDGTVEVAAEGDRDRLEKLLAALRRGPRSAYVSNVSVQWEDASGEFKDFRVRMTG